MIWDVVIAGAGPAGAMAAIAAARAGRSVLLLDRARFPRAKVCGGCLNPAALALLESVGLVAEVQRHGVPLRELRLAAPGVAARVALAPGVAIERRTLDALLVRRALEAGATFVDGARVDAAGLAPDGATRRVLVHGDDATAVDARLVLVACGLGGRVDGQPPPARMRDRLVGIGGLAVDHTAAPPPGRLVMACAPGGYAGVVRLDAAHVDVGAAVRPAFLRAAGGPRAAVDGILRAAGVEPPAGLGTLRGVPGLERRPAAPALARLLVAGDAVAAHPPFTGQGIAWALASGHAAGRLAVAATAAGAWDRRWERAWGACVSRMTRHRRRTAWLPSLAAEHPRLMRIAVGVLALRPSLAAPLVRAIGRMPRGAGPPPVDTAVRGP